MTADAQQQAWDRQDRESRVARLTAKQLEVDDLAERIVALNRELSQARRKHQEARWELATLVRLLTATGPCRPAARPGQPPVPREETPAGRSLDPDPGDGQSPSAEDMAEARRRYGRDENWGMVPPDESPAVPDADGDVDREQMTHSAPPTPAPEPFESDGPPYSVYSHPDCPSWTVLNRHGIPWYSCTDEAKARAECDRLNAQEQAHRAAQAAPLPAGTAPATRIELPLWHLSRLTAILPRGRDGHAEARMLAQKAQRITTLGELDAYLSHGGDLAPACARPDNLLAALGAWWAGHMAGHEPPAWLQSQVPAAATDAPPAEPEPAPAPGPRRRRKKGGAL
jgi:hypothetical protein